MKNKLLVCAFAVAFVASVFTSCKDKLDFDAICDDVSTQTLKGLFSGASLFGDTLKVAEYMFQKDGSVDFSYMLMGDGLYAAPITKKYSSWEFGEYNEQYLGRYVILHPEDGGVPKQLNFTRAFLYEEGMPIMSDKNDKVAELPKLQDSITGRIWYGNDTTFYKIDTTVNIVYLDTFTHRDVIGTSASGRPIYGEVIDSIVERLEPTKMKWPVGPSKIAERRIELNRDPNTLVNTGKWYVMRKEYEYDANRVAKQTLDTVSAYNFHWTFIEYSNMGNFSIVATEDGTNNGELFILKYDAKIPAITLDKQVLKVVTE